MSATDIATTLAVALKFEAPSGDVNFCDGGFAYFDSGAGSEKYDAEHPVFGTLGDPDDFESGFGDMAESAGITFLPPADAALTDYYSLALRDSRVRFWFGEIASDGKTLENEEQLGDFFVDVPSRTINSDGTVSITLDLIGRPERLFLINEGNVASERFHKSIWPGEQGFDNCTDTPVPVAWGIASPSTGTTRGSGAGTSPGSNVNVSLF